MAGQGTLGFELISQLPEGLDAVFIPVGGGGLIGGVAAALKSLLPNCRVVGCQPAASDVMRQSVAAGRIVEVPSQETLSDATAGGCSLGLHASASGQRASNMGGRIMVAESR